MGGDATYWGYLDCVPTCSSSELAGPLLEDGASLLFFDNAIREFEALDPDAVDLLLLCFLMVKGWLLGTRLTGSGVTVLMVHVEEAFRGFCQSLRLWSLSLEL